jgi:hypothetical protein
LSSASRITPSSLVARARRGERACGTGAIVTTSTSGSDYDTFAADLNALLEFPG